MDNHHTNELQLQIFQLQQIISHQNQQLNDLNSQLQTSKSCLINIQNQIIKDGIQILGKKISSQMHYRNLLPSHPFLTESIHWVENFGILLKDFSVGTLIQPLPNFRPSSPRIIIHLSSVEEIEKIFPNRLKREFNGGSYATLDPPLDLIWSCKTKKFGAKFKYPFGGKRSTKKNSTKIILTPNTESANTAHQK